jgi:hypothetical protein
MACVVSAIFKYVEIPQLCAGLACTAVQSRGYRIIRDFKFMSGLQ